MNILRVILALVAIVIPVGYANIDGNPSEWVDVPVAFSLYRGGDTSKPIEAHVQMVYDCTDGIAAIHVTGIAPLLVQTDEAWVLVDGVKVVSDQDTADGVIPDFSWVNSTGEFADGFEANFHMGVDVYSIQVHVNVYDDGESQTATNTVTVQANCAPTAVYVADLEAITRGSSVTLTWLAGTGHGVAGYHVEAESYFTGEYEIITEQMIPTQGELIGSRYSYTTSAFPGIMRCYRVRIVMIGGHRTSGSVCIAPPIKRWLPWAWRR